MILLEITFKIANAEIDSFVAAARAAAQCSNAESGCEKYVFSVDLDVPTTFHLLEQWRSEDALRAHYQTHHFLEFAAFLKRINCERTRRARSGELQPWQLQPSG